MMIRKECLGLNIVAKSPHNACTFNLVISDNPENFALYKVLQLDVFETDIPPIAEIVEDKPKSKKKKDLDVID
jgi:hypothetical protein